MMKKRASLLISGITTAALVVTAIGSFAAWDTLTNAPVSFSATSGNPAVLETVTGGTPSTEKLIPEDSLIIKASETGNLSLGT
ncbi:MAG: hypothetical protein RR564_04305, partial [Eubacterium sp.]